MENKNLDGYVVGNIYEAELSHGLMGYFPLIETDKDEPVYCSDIEVLKQILKSVKPRKFKINKIPASVGTKDAIVVVRDKHVNLELTKNVADKKFSWASGLLSLDGHPSEENYFNNIDNLCI